MLLDCTVFINTLVAEQSSGLSGITQQDSSKTDIGSKAPYSQPRALYLNVN